ncbi:Ca2+-dependent phosphoinositide-specific phospholipase C [Luteimonas huabeiensis]|uniref:Ca2+-dependent phosphoinositide-specific phospholipase C n=1 Tax=Luteimonas huabeiensis TaxID=1244513 RepID=UPI0004B03389|nr:Ca2+-dependent phosphoinositide-specific phospholipase C [Luteimonas huabeiensis]
MRTLLHGALMLAAFACSAPAAAACDLDAADAAAAGPGCHEAWMDRHLRLNDLLAVGTHNSYKQAIPAAEYALIAAHDPGTAQALDYAHKSIEAQLDFGARQLEIDVVHDPEGGRHADPLLARATGTAPDPAWGAAMRRPGFKVMHVPDIDWRSDCVLLSDCLRRIGDWSRRHPRHAPILILINAKDAGDVPGGTPLLKFDAAAFDALDAAFRAGLPEGAIITPDEVQGEHATLREAVRAGAWPTLGQARGRFVIALDESPEKVALYRGSRRALEGRAMFVNIDEASPAAGYITLNNIERDGERIARAVDAGLLVRSRADDNTWQARRNDTAWRERTLASGAQWVSTDYLWPDARFPGGFRVHLPGLAAAVCNPRRAAARCAGLPVETVEPEARARADRAPFDAPAPRAEAEGNTP